MCVLPRAIQGSMAAPKTHEKKARILVLHTPDAPELEVLKRLPSEASIVGIGRTLDGLSGV